MFGGAPLAAPGAHGLDLGIVLFYHGVVGTGRELDQGVQWHRHPRALFLGLLHEVGVDAADNGLMRDDEDIFAALEFHDDGLEANDNIAVALTASISVVVFIFVARLKVLRILVCNLLVCQAVANTSI